jgi:hypothetical protein
VRAIHSASTAPTSVELPFAPGALVKPALKTKGAAAEVLALSADGTEICLVAFSGRMADPVAAGAIVWRAHLPRSPEPREAISAALAPAGRGRERHVAFVAAAGDGLRIFHTRFRDEVPPAEFGSVQCAGGRPIAGAPVAMCVDAEGRARVGILTAAPAAGGGATFECALVEAVFPAAGGGSATVTTTPLGTSDEELVAGAVSYDLRPGEEPRRACVLETKNRRLLRADLKGALLPMDVAGRIEVSPLVAPGKSAFYRLGFDVRKGPTIERL